MKFIRTIVAFFSVYVFLACIAAFLIVSYWLTTFVSDSPANEVAKIKVGSLETTSAPFVVEENKGTNALVSTITRGVDSSEFTGHGVLAARSTVLFASFDQITLSEILVPLGYKTLFRLNKITDAQGRVLYERKDSIVDAILFKVLGAHLSRSTQNITLVAYDKPITYTITATEEKLFIAKEYED